MTIDEIKQIVVRDCGASAAAGLAEAELPSRKAEYYKYTDLGSALSFSSVEQAECPANFSAMAASTSDAQSFVSRLACSTSANVFAIHINKDTAEPINIDIKPSAKPESLTTYRLKIQVGRGVKAQAVVNVDGQAGATLLVNIDIDLASDSQLEIVMHQTQAAARLFSHVEVKVGSNATLSTTTVNVDPATARNELVVDLNGEGAQACVNGLYIAGAESHVDNNTLIRHNVPHCESQELYKGIIDKGGVGAFAGKIQVEPGAQKTQANQTNRNMLLSPDAHAYSQPQLEIYADDVKCSHGSTTGQLDEAHLFYMQTRGIDRDTARRLLTAAFASEVIEKIGIEAERERLSSIIIKTDEL